MTTTRLASDAAGIGLDPAARARLVGYLERAAATARRERRPVIASASAPIDPALDLSAVVLAARGPDERAFCFEQPDREGFALACLGAAATVEGSGPRRFVTAAAEVRALARDAEVDGARADRKAPAHAGPVWVGGFAFADDGGQVPEWSSLAPAQLILPRVALARRAGEARLTATCVIEPDSDPVDALARIDEALSRLRPATMPVLDPDLARRPRVAGAAPPAHYEEAVARAVERIVAGRIRKVVLAREVRVHAPGPIDPAPVFDGLRGGFPGCFSYCVVTPELTFLGASPELLVRREGSRAQTVALAGTTRRSADPAVDRHLGERLLQSPKEREEHEIVARRIQSALAPVSLWVAAAEEPELVRVQNVQHLATPIRAQLSEPLHVLELVGRLHPTPAVGGEPWEDARELIPALEALDRGWYAGPIGWAGLDEDGEFCVGLRCALIRGEVARLYAGDGIVAGSVPEQELAETEVKLQALLPLLT